MANSASGPCKVKELRKQLMEKCRELAEASIALNHIEQEVIEIVSQIEVLEHENAKMAKTVDSRTDGGCQAKAV